MTLCGSYIIKQSISILYRLILFKWKYSIEVTESFLKIQDNGKQIVCHYSTIASQPESLNGLLWNRISITNTDGKRLALAGLRKDRSEALHASIIKSIRRYHFNKIHSAIDDIRGAIDCFNNIFDNKYIKYSKIEEWKNDNKEIVHLLANQYAIDIMPKNIGAQINQFKGIFNNCHDIRTNHNNEFIENETKHHDQYFNNVESKPLTRRQRLACVTNEDNTLVIAAAGSGKTSVIISKAGYLIESGSVQPDEILILAYGRKASKETDDRIKDRLPNANGVKTSTFHKLGLGIIAKVDGTKPGVSRLQEAPAEFYKFINNAIDRLRLSIDYSQRIIDYFVSYLIPHEDAFNYDQQGDYFCALKEQDLYSIKSLIASNEPQKERYSFKKERMRSHEEVIIADYLGDVNFLVETKSAPWP